MARTLSPDLLERLDRRLGVGGALERSEVERLTADFAGDLPAEAWLWWMSRGQGLGTPLPGVQHASLQDAMTEYEFRRREAAVLTESDDRWDKKPTDLWHPSWLTVFGIDGGMVYVIDCALSDGECAPLRLIDWQDLGGQHFARIAADSLGEFVIHALDQGSTVG
jgi:hypothetical protein